jgi:hypothetical protein
VADVCKLYTTIHNATSGSCQWLQCARKTKGLLEYVYDAKYGRQRQGLCTCRSVGIIQVLEHWWGRTSITTHTDAHKKMSYFQRIPTSIWILNRSIANATVVYKMINLNLRKPDKSTTTYNFKVLELWINQPYHGNLVRVWMGLYVKCHFN